MAVIVHRLPLRTSAPGAQRAVVAAGDDRVPDGCLGAVVQPYLGACVDHLGEYEVGAGALVQRGDHRARLGDEDARQPGSPVALPCGVGGVGHALGFARADAAVRLIGVDGLDTTVAQVERGVLLPGRGDAAHVGQLGHVLTVGDEHPERSPGIDGLELGGVAHEQHLRPDVGRDAHEPVEGKRSGERCLVHDHELLGGESHAVVAVGLPPLRGVFRRDAEVTGQHFGRDRGRCQADY